MIDTIANMESTIRLPLEEKLRLQEEPGFSYRYFSDLELACRPAAGPEMKAMMAEGWAWRYDLALSVFILKREFEE